MQLFNLVGESARKKPLVLINLELALQNWILFFCIKSWALVMNYDVFSGFRYANFRREASGISTKKHCRNGVNFGYMSIKRLHAQCSLIEFLIWWQQSIYAIGLNKISQDKVVNSEYGKIDAFFPSFFFLLKENWFLEIISKLIRYFSVSEHSYISLLFKEYGWFGPHTYPKLSFIFGSKIGYWKITKNI